MKINDNLKKNSVFKVFCLYKEKKLRNIIRNMNEDLFMFGENFYL